MAAMCLDVELMVWDVKETGRGSKHAIGFGSAEKTGTPEGLKFKRRRGRLQLSFLLSPLDSHKMALPSAAARRLACGNCRQWMLRSFISSLGASPVHQTPPSKRAIGYANVRRNEARERVQKDEKEDFALNDINGEYENQREKTQEVAEDVEDEDERTDVLRRQQQTAEAELDPEIASPPNTNEHVPWYLQVQSPIDTKENAVSERQKIPDLPECSPPILEPLMKRVSVELGMDDLSLLDLRAIDPPPALGANLLMLVGTARSEKHLHFSADKLCRWLRTEYRLTPIADGLLGRQELKLKMRRRAKKSRLLSAVGAKSTADTELEEGIRTGWICVNLGKVEGGELPKTKEQTERESKIVGFGTGLSGSHIVVQLLTEEKRGEMDLEKLWSTILRQSQREADALQEQEPGQAANGASSLERASDRLQPAGGSTYNPMVAPATQHQHARAYHTSARRLQAFSIASQPVSGDSSAEVPGTTDPDGMADVEGSTSEVNDHVQAQESSYITALVNLLNGIEPMTSDYRDKLDAALDFMEDMESRGYNALRPEVLEALHQALMGPPTDLSDTTLQSVIPALGVAKLKRHMASGNINKFWRAWASFPRHLLPRTPGMYALLFDAIASGKITTDYPTSRHVISTNIIDMEAEQPPLVIDEENVELAVSLFKAMRFADPDNELKDWNDMRQHCEAVLRATLEKRPNESGSAV